MIEVKVINKSNNPLPAYAHAADAGCDLMADLSSLNKENFKGKNAYLGIEPEGNQFLVIRPGGTALVPVGLFTAIPEGYEVQVRPRSGLALKHSITVLNTPGTIDSQYRSEWGVILINHGLEPFIVKQGDRIAQAVLNKVEQIKWNQVESLDETERKGGFGSTGIDVIDSTVVEEPVVVNSESPKLTASEILEDTQSKSKKSSKK